jgi:hypothetical protein
MVYGVPSPRVKLSGHEADHSPPSGAEVYNVWRCTSIPQYVFMVQCLVKQRDNFTFTFVSLYIGGLYFIVRSAGFQTPLIDVMNINRPIDSLITTVKEKQWLR